MPVTTARTSASPMTHARAVARGSRQREQVEENRQNPRQPFCLPTAARSNHSVANDQKRKEGDADFPNKMTIVTHQGSSLGS